MTTRLAVLLVAGIGSRLRPLTDDRPKALVDVGGETILGRAVRLLAEHGVQEVVLATGYRDEAVKAALASAPLRCTFVHNPRYDSTQNSVSLALCAAAIAGRPFFKLDGDVVYRREVLERLAHSRASLAVALDTGRTLDAEAMKVTLDPAPRIAAFGKGIALAASAGESIGIERLDAAASRTVLDALQESSLERDRLYYEDVYSELIAAGRLAAEAVDVADLPWTEIDDPSDLARARDLVARGAV